MKLKKDSFLKGAFIASLGVFISKILGLIYIIPFNKAVGTKGMALYGYAYTIYNVFLGISSVGIPIAMSKITSEYNAKAYVDTKRRIFFLGSRLLTILGIISFFILMVGAPWFAKLIIGNAIGGNTVEEITQVIRTISFAILVVPFMSTLRGYFQGHKFIKPTGVSQVLEQIVRVGIIIIGSIFGAKAFNLSTFEIVKVSLAAATIGAIVSLIYLLIVKKENDRLFNEKSLVEEEEKSDKELMLQLVFYASPIIILEIFKSFYYSIDTFLLVKKIPEMFQGISIVETEAAFSVINTTGFKLNMIIVALSTGVMVSLVPNLSEALTNKNYKEAEDKINQTLELLLLLSIPMAIGLSFLTPMVWNLFYGKGTIEEKIYAFYVFVSIASIIFSSVAIITQTLNKPKLMLLSVLSGFITKLVLNVPSLYVFNNLGFPPYYGAIFSTIIGYLVCSFICLYYIKKTYRISYGKTLKTLIDVLAGSALMLLALVFLKRFVPFSLNKKTLILLIALYSLVGGGIYFLYVYFTGTFKRVLRK